MSNNLSFAAIDFETATNLPRSACSIGVAVVDNGVISDSRSWLIQPPNNRYLQQNIDVHGMDSTHTANSLTFDRVWPAVSAFISARTLVAHKATFDGGVLKYSAEFYGYSLPSYNILCSKEVGGVAFTECSGNSLSVLANHLGIELNHHEALSDANAAAEIMIAAASESGAYSIEEVSSAYGIPITRIADADYFEISIMDADNLYAKEGFCSYMVAVGRCGEPVESEEDGGRCPTHR